MAQYVFPASEIGKNGVEYYAIGGVTVEFQPITGGVLSGIWANLGPVNDVQPNFDVERYEHYDARSGTRLKDLTLVVSKAMSFTFTTDEINPFVVSALFQGLGYLGSGTTVTVTNESTTFGANDLAPLMHIPKATPAPVVTDTSGSTTYVAGTDYDVVIGPDGVAYLYRKPGSSIPPNATVLVDYSYDSGTELVVTPFTADSIEGKVRITFRAAQGKNWRYEHTKATLSPEGNVSLSPTEVSTAQFRLDILADDAATVTVGSNTYPAPFGYLRYGIAI